MRLLIIAIAFIGLGLFCLAAVFANASRGRKHKGGELLFELDELDQPRPFALGESRKPEDKGQPLSSAGNQGGEEVKR